MVDINKENTELLDSQKVQEYLSFVASVAYKNTFIFRSKIYEYAKKNKYSIDEYSVKINGADIFKEYTTRLKDINGNIQNNYDEISDVEFKDFRDNDGNLLAWMWIGLSRFEKQIPIINLMRGIRLRSANIQIGGDNSLAHLFKEQRGNYYFVGEVFAVNKQLIPNSQRNYFNENETRVAFEDKLRDYFYDELHKLYYAANKIKNAYKRQEEYIYKVNEYKKKNEDNGFVDEEDRQKMQSDIEQAKKKAEEAEKQLSKFNDIKNSPLAEVHKSIGKHYGAESLKKKVDETAIGEETSGSKNKSFVTSSMSKLTRNERKIVSKILSIITDNAPKEIAELLINKIKEEMR